MNTVKLTQAKNALCRAHLQYAFNASPTLAQLAVAYLVARGMDADAIAGQLDAPPVVVRDCITKLETGEGSVRGAACLTATDLMKAVGCYAPHGDIRPWLRCNPKALGRLLDEWTDFDVDLEVAAKLLDLPKSYLNRKLLDYLCEKCAGYGKEVV